MRGPAPAAPAQARLGAQATLLDPVDLPAIAAGDEQFPELGAVALHAVPLVALGEAFLEGGEGLPFAFHDDGAVAGADGTRQNSRGRKTEVLLHLEGGGFDEDEINQAFRVVHTIKGSASILALDSFVALPHRMEDLLDQLLTKNQDPSDELIQLLFQCADALEQMGYQAESGPWRNFYLSGAQELRNGVAKLPTPNTASPDTIRAMSLGLFFDYLGMKLNGPKADGKHIVLNFDFTDTKEKYAIEMVHGVLNHTPDHQAEGADATITLTRETLNQIVLQQTTLQKAIGSKAVVIAGDEKKLTEMLSYLDSFEFWFNIVTPHKT